MTFLIGGFRLTNFGDFRLTVFGQFNPTLTIKRWFTFSLAFMLILGTINYSPLKANATTATTISGNDVVGTTENEANNS